MATFSLRHEGWFGRDTYAGGVDKVSHFYYGTVGQEALSSAYEKLGHPSAEARTLALANTALSAVVVEIGDAFTSYGFSWEDAVATTAGAVAYSLLSSAGWQDTVGFRFGWSPSRRPIGEEGGPPHRSPILLENPRGRLATHAVIESGYSYEIYTADVKLSGLLPRFGIRPGAARYLLVSTTFQVRGYNELAPELRQRHLGLELGLNLPEILRAIGLRETKWWARPVLLFLEHFRVPYSAIGIRYDVNGRRWSGPDFGDAVNVR